MINPVRSAGFASNNLFLAAIALCFIAFGTACDPKDKPVKVSSITLSAADTTYLNIGDTLQIVATIAPSDATDPSLSWASSNANIASVSNGTVIAHSSGEATITATANDGSGCTATCLVQVRTPEKPHVAVDSVALNITETSISLTETLTLKATVFPETATNQNVTWSSNDPCVDVSTTGVITPQTFGTARITVVTQDGKKIAQCTITVNMGTVGFRSDSVWTVGNQTWSDAVIAQSCQKETYDAGSYADGVANYLPDCRKNAGYGDLFSWPAVGEFAEVLCPGEWRVPTREDYIALDTTFGGKGELQNSSALRDRYLAEWGGKYGGYCENGKISPTGQHAYYWSITENSAPIAFSAYLTNKGDVNPNSWGNKNFGYMVRCVKNN